MTIPTTLKWQATGKTIGQGGQGTVVEVIDKTSDDRKTYALKWSAITGLNTFGREAPIFNAKSMNALFPDRPDCWHLHHIFEKTIRRDPKNRWKTVNEALQIAQRIHFLISAGYPALEEISKFCPICGYGSLQRFDGGHMVFGNPNPPGISSLQCTYCGICLAVNTKKLTQLLTDRKNIE